MVICDGSAQLNENQSKVLLLSTLYSDSRLDRAVRRCALGCFLEWFRALGKAIMGDNIECSCIIVANKDDLGRIDNI